MPSPIPIQNLYYLFCYAWDRFPESKSIDVGKIQSPEIVDLLALVLIRGLQRLIRRGLDRGYVEIEDDLSSLRGRIMLGETVRRNLLLHARASCRFDELQHDILHNQIVKATLQRLLDTDNLDTELADRVASLARSLSGVTDIRVSSHVFRRVQLSRNTAHYGLLLRVCELVHECLLPQEGGRTSTFTDILRDENRMSDIFERFVRNFYRTEQHEYSAAIELIAWDAPAVDSSQLRYLPQMRTDVSLRSATRTIVLDTKYYPEALSNYRGGEKIRSDHLYQLFAYIKN